MTYKKAVTFTETSKSPQGNEVNKYTNYFKIGNTMNASHQNAAPRNNNEECPPRQSSSRCATNHIAGARINQPDYSVNKTVYTKPQGDNMNKIAVFPSQQENSITANHFNPKQLEILKNSICKGVSNEEFEIFLMACIKTQLDPFMRQIYAVKRKAKKPDGSWGETMTIQTGIDGYRLIAERTERYAPGPEPTYVHDNQGNLISATAYIKKQTKDGTWHTVSASAYIDEYCQKTRDGHPMGMWGNMPRTMLSKCAEAQALRKAFPAEMSGVYTKEEMEQADVVVSPIVAASIQKITFDQAKELEHILSECEEKYRLWVYDYILKQYNTQNLCDVPTDIYNRMKEAATKNMENNLIQQRLLQESGLLVAEVQ